MNISNRAYNRHLHIIGPTSFVSFIFRFGHMQITKSIQTYSWATCDQWLISLLQWNCERVNEWLCVAFLSLCRHSDEENQGLNCTPTQFLVVICMFYNAKSTKQTCVRNMNIYCDIAYVLRQLPTSGQLGIRAFILYSRIKWAYARRPSCNRK